jgi:hypothetical protein
MKKLFVLFFLVGLVSLLNACSTQIYHKILMKGQVVAIEDDEVTICIGRRDGAKIGDELRVVRSMFRQGVVEEGESSFELIEVGRIKISRVIDDHYAKANIINGSIKLNDIGEKVNE